MAVHVAYCFATPTLLKWLQMILCAVIIGLIEKGLYAWSAYAYILVVAIICLVATFVLMVIYFGGFHGNMTCWSWLRAEGGFNVLGCIMMFIAFGIAVYDTVKMYDNSYAHQDHPGQYGGVGGKEWKERMAAISACTGLNGLLYICSGTWVQQRGIIVVT